MGERVNWLKSLNKDELATLVEVHHRCERECGQRAS